MFVNDVLQLHDSLRLLAERDVRVSLLQQRAGNLVGLRPYRKLTGKPSRVVQEAAGARRRAA